MRDDSDNSFEPEYGITNNAKRNNDLLHDLPEVVINLKPTVKISSDRGG